MRSTLSPSLPFCLASGLLYLLAAGDLYAEAPGYWVTGSGKPYTNRNDTCWHNSNWQDADYLGVCEGDQDEDRVPDEIDQCPDTPIGTPVDDRGCPLDGDGDGVVDGQDRCPDTPPGVVVDEYGCTLDSDGDGVADNLDRCPGTPPNTPVDEFGCPDEAAMGAMEQARRTESAAWAFDRPHFPFDSVRLSAEAKQRLDAALVQMRADPAARFRIIGHTDSIGPDAYNERLAIHRAEAAKAYLVNRGIAPKRLVTEGHGETRPIADNRTAAGRAENRRVEIEVLPY